MQSTVAGENVITDLRTILEEALERVKTEIFGSGPEAGGEQAGAGVPRRHADAGHAAGHDSAEPSAGSRRQGHPGLSRDGGRSRAKAGRRPCRTGRPRSWARSRRGPVRGEHPVDEGRTPVCSQKRARRASWPTVPMVVPVTDSWVKKIRVSSAGGASPLVAPQITIRPPGLRERTECAQVAWPTLSMTTSTRSGSRAPAEGLVGAELDRALALGLGAAGRPDPVARPRGRAGSARWRPRRPRPGPAWSSRAGRRTSRTASCRRSGRPSGGRRPPRRTARRAWAPGSAAAPDQPGEGAVVAFGQQGPAGVEGLVSAARIRVADHRVDDDLVAVRVHPGRVAAEHDRQAVRGDAHPAQRPHVMVVERRRLDPYRHPAVRRRRVGPLAQLQAGQRVIASIRAAVAANTTPPYRGRPAQWQPPCAGGYAEDAGGQAGYRGPGRRERGPGDPLAGARGVRAGQPRDGGSPGGAPPGVNSV